MDGFIVVNKPRDWTSRDVVNKVGCLLKTKKVGHTGTLDPLATGVLVLAIGKGLKLVDLIISEKKEYIAEVQPGLLTDTLDITGQVLKEEPYHLDENKIKQVLNSFIGKSIQEVPLYSSIKVAGKRLYEYAHQGKKVELPKREIEIFQAELLEVNQDSFSFKVEVSKGTYIRSLIRDIGLKLGFACSMKSLMRTKQGQFSLRDSCSLADIENDAFRLISLYEALLDYKIIEVDDYLSNRIKNGALLENRYIEEKIVFTNREKEVLAIYEVYNKDKTKVKPWRIFK